MKICLTFSEHLHFRQVFVAHEIKVKHIKHYNSETLDYPSAHLGKGSASVLLHTCSIEIGANA